MSSEDIVYRNEEWAVIDHLSYGVSNLVQARRFYDAFFGPLGHAVASVAADEISYGPGGMSGAFFLYQAPAGAQIAGARTHVAFTAATRAAVDQAYAAAMAGGAQSVRKAGAHPDISPNYYGAVVLDPDGNKLEVVVPG